MQLRERPASSNRDFDHNVTAGLRSINCRNDLPDHSLNHPPTVATEHNDRESSTLQILLISEPVVRRPQYFEISFFRRSKQVSVFKAFPTPLAAWS
jgi:hypothetical protein